MPKLKVISRYQNRDVVYELGSIISVSPDEYRFLKADSPGCFEDYDEAATVATKAAEKPPADKQVKASSTTRKRKAAAKKK